MVRVPYGDFDWDSGNLAKCQKHGMSIAEIEHVLRHAATRMVPAKGTTDGERRLIAVGKTASGRSALVVFTPRNFEGEIRLRPISARFMHIKELNRYEQAIARLQER